MEHEPQSSETVPVSPDMVQDSPTRLSPSPLGLPSPEPTLEDIAAGRVSTSEMRPAFGTESALRLQLRQTLQKERRKMKLEAKARQREEYERGRKDALAKVGDIEDAWVEYAERIALKLLKDEPLNKQELKILPTIHKTIEAVKDRALGKPTSHIEAEHNHNVLHAMAQMNAGWDDPKGSE